MIKRFSVLYVGQIDLDDVGADGRAPDDRRYSNKQLTQSLDHAMALAKQMDESGFYCLWSAGDFQDPARGRTHAYKDDQVLYPAHTGMSI